MNVTHPDWIDWKTEQEASLARPRMKYTTAARFFFWAMDSIYGKELTLPKIKLIEILARIPYHAWEWKAYWKMTLGYSDAKVVAEAEELMKMGRDAQDNEFWHLIVAVEKIREDKVRENQFMYGFLPVVLVIGYAIFARTLATFHIRGALYFNGIFEDHAEHEYANFVKNHPELDEQPVTSPLIQKYGPYKSWGDVFRRIMLDERIHRNTSLEACGRASEVVPYASQPPAAQG